MPTKIAELIAAMQSLNDAIWEAWVPDDLGDRNADTYATPNRQKMLREHRVKHWPAVRHLWLKVGDANSPAMGELQRAGLRDVEQVENAVSQWARSIVTMLYPSDRVRQASDATYDVPDIEPWSTDGATLRQKIARNDLGSMPKATAIASAGNRRGRPNRADSEAKRTAMLARLRQHPSLADDPKSLAVEIGVSVKTMRKWVDAERRKYEESAPRRPGRRNG